jgi:hypothetical protein
MRLVTLEDENGYLQQYYVKDSDPDSMAKKGMQHKMPDLSQIDWEDVQKELHNILVQRGLVTWRDVQEQQNSLVPAIVSVMKRRLIALYRQKI